MWQDNLWNGWRRGRRTELSINLMLAYLLHLTVARDDSKNNERFEGGGGRLSSKNANIFYVGQVEWICWVSLAQNAKWSGSKEFHTMWTDQQQFLLLPPFPSPLSVSLSLCSCCRHMWLWMMEDEQISQQINRQTNNARRNRTKRREEKTQINQKISAHSEDMEGGRAGRGRG